MIELDEAAKGVRDGWLRGHGSRPGATLQGAWEAGYEYAMRPELDNGFDAFCGQHELSELERDQCRAHLVESRIRKLMEWYFDTRTQTAGKRAQVKP